MSKFEMRWGAFGGSVATGLRCGFRRLSTVLVANRIPSGGRFSRSRSMIGRDCAGDRACPALSLEMKPLPDVRHIQTDVLIVGAGVAGMMAVVGAKRSGVTPLVATKGTYASGSSSMARGGHSVALG